jgi:RecA/RadA recombinase
VYGSPETTPGGRALKFYASVRLDIRRTGAVKEGEVTVGSRTRARVLRAEAADSGSSSFRIAQSSVSVAGLPCR